MNTQLRLLDSNRTWRLDERTREIGRAGVAQARAALRESARHGIGADLHQSAPANDPKAA